MPQESAISTSRKYRPDVLIFLLLIPVISAFNYYLTYSNIQWNGFLVLTFSIDTVQGYLAWLIVRRLIIWLDHVMPFGPKPTKRILIQLVLTTFAGLSFIIATTEMVSWIAKGKPAIPEFYSMDVFIIGVWFLVINGIYIGLFYYHSLQEIQQEKFKTQPDLMGIPVKSGNQELLIPRSELAVLKIEEEYVLLFAVNGKKYFLDESLDYWEKILPESDFFRLNRQTLIHRQVLLGFKKLDHGKLEAQVGPSFNFDLELGISRAKAPAFRAWFMPNR
ncbi:LytTR family transcriptional regulator [Algoriphagus lacus]|uniref:LytTR family transcriptional regulator n=1 Tax=Algoriphagus lacus TaxID=2056311 RepID=A0A418PSI6_9BACT|nr:LytTR family DNA-binding domain-containing protein [Algoriphagus lacus]RIW15820.1 LytTR family transcriptional regulator [Algoriphagus lacus]